MKPLVDDLLLGHLVYEKETIHLITTLYGILAPYESVEHHVKIAKSLELMKSSTLIMDDFLDKSSLRNGMPSLYAKFGGEEAGLIAEILKSTASIAFSAELIKLNDLDKNDVLKCLLLFEDTYRTVCMGQLDDLRACKGFWNGDNVTEKDYYEIIKKTTAVFIQLPVLLGAIMNRFNIKLENSLRKYGLYIGLAYQIRDDVIDLVGEPSSTGKPLGGDITEKKVRLPLIYALKHGRPEQISKIRNIYRKKQLTSKDLFIVIELFTEIGSINYCNQIARNYCSAAIKSIKALPTDLRGQLEDVAMMLIPD